jgi:hypothetical protein
MRPLKDPPKGSVIYLINPNSPTTPSESGKILLPYAIGWTVYSF